MSRLIVGFTGKIGSGKTTAALELQSIGWVRTRFADTLKQMVACLGLNAAHIDGDQKEVPQEILCGKTPRHAMQTLGTEWGRDLIGEDLWVNAWKQRVSLEAERNIVVDDVRFSNEAKVIRQLGGYVILIKRPVLQSPALPQSPTSTIQAPHSSELLDFQTDYHIDNIGSKDLFIDNVHQLVLGLRAIQ